MSSASQRVIGFCNYWLVADLRRGPHPRRSRPTPITGAPASGRGCSRTRSTRAARSARTLATLEVRRGNRPAIALYERAGFRTVHVRPRYYQDDGEDALVMLRRARASLQRAGDRHAVARPSRVAEVDRGAGGAGDERRPRRRARTSAGTSAGSPPRRDSSASTLISPSGGSATVVVNGTKPGLLDADRRRSRARAA